MRVVWILVVLIVIGVALDWFRDAQKEQTKKVMEKPRSETLIVSTLDRGKTGVAAINMNEFKQAIILHKINKGTLPQSLEELIQANYLQPGSQYDPYGQIYELQYMGREAVISSPGPDKVRGSQDDVIVRFVVD